MCSTRLLLHVELEAPDLFTWLVDLVLMQTCGRHFSYDSNSGRCDQSINGLCDELTSKQIADFLVVAGAFVLWG